MKVVYEPILPIIRKLIDSAPRKILRIELTKEELEAVHHELWLDDSRTPPYVEFVRLEIFVYMGATLVWTP